VINDTLLTACRVRDRGAQRQLYDLMAARLYHTCRRYLRHESDVEEALADTFYLIFTKLDQLKDTAAFEAWARKIAVNTCLAVIRKKEAPVSYVEEISETQQAGYALHPDGLAEKDLLRLLERLPEGCRMVFSLFVIEGYSHKEIAALLQISEGTSKSQLNFSRQKLQSMVNQFYFLNEN